LRNSGRKELFATGDGCWDITNFLEPAGSAVYEGEGILVLSATPELGRVPGSLEFAERYMGQYGRVGNYAVNSYDATKVLLAAISSAAKMCNAVPARESIAGTLRDQSFQGIAYPDPVSWKNDGDNVSAVTALYVAGSDGFKQLTQIPRSDAQ
jgi:branched-chain amino acid transport system substrate-binding protein